ncbi:hypothetical protein [Streptomyces geranii]|uniref:hypothetical protein n=1 Tax=Streptomyces geranii TaxID=2058923 RepID=UPI001300AFA7|nr:hypothetical protein [Streptomyces geranii]
MTTRKRPSAARLTGEPDEGNPVSSLRLLVLFLLVLVAAMLLGGLTYVTYRHPALATPLGVATGAAAVLVACVGVILARQ